jgi:hypothetical protein
MGQSYCQTDAEIDNALSLINIEIAAPSFFFDIDDYVNPIKVAKINKNEYGLSSEFYQKHYVTVQVNQAEVFDKIWMPSYWPEEYEYISLDTTDFFLLHPSADGVLTEIDIVMDSKYYAVERQVYTMVHLCSDVGGIIAVLIPLGAFLVHTFNEKVYMMTMMSFLYHVNPKECTKKVTPSNENNITGHRDMAQTIHKVSSIILIN